MWLRTNMFRFWKNVRSNAKISLSLRFGRRRGRRRERLKFFARLEANGFARRDANLLPSARISSDAGFAGLHVEDAEAAQLDAFAAAESVLHRFEYGFHGLLSLGARDVGFLNDCVDDIE